MKRKKLAVLKRLTIAAIGVGLLGTCAAVFAKSYNDYQNYYQTMIKEKEQYEKEHAPEVTVMTGISVKIKDNVGFYKNGKAQAIKSNFVVEGLYTIGNEVNQRQYSEEISDYTIEAPEDFVTSGGEVKFHYLKQEAEVDEEGKTKVDEDGNTIYKTIYDFTESLTIDLEDVKPTTILIKQNPYIVTYKDGDRFNSDGLVIDIINNDGSTFASDVDGSLLTIDNSKLKTGTTSVKVAFKYGDEVDDVTYGEIPVTVMDEDIFTYGDLISLTLVSDDTIEEGSTLDDYPLSVYALYSSGNRVLLDKSQYKLSGIDGAATFGSNYRIVVTSTENSEKSIRKAVTCVKSISTNDAVASGVSKYDDHFEDFDNGDYVEFTYNATEAAIANFNLKMSNGYYEYTNGKIVTKDIDFNDFAYLSINGYAKTTDYTLTGGGIYEYVDEAYADYQKVNFGAYRIKSGENKIRITFKNSNTGKTSAYNNYVAGAVANLEIMPTTYSADVTKSFGENVVNSETANFDISKNWDWDGKLSWTYASCADDEYAYLYVRSAGNSNVQIVKVDLSTNTIIAKSAAFTLYNENYTPFFIKDSYIYTIVPEGTFVRLPTSFSGDGTEKVKPVPNLTFEGISDVLKIKTAAYNSKEGKYAIFSNNGLDIFDSNKKLLIHKSASAVKVTSDDNYIYSLTYKSNGVITPKIAIYDWSGNVVKSEFSIPNTAAIMGVSATGSTNVQSIFVKDNALYFTVLTWGTTRSDGTTGTGNATSIYKTIISGSENNTKVNERLDLGEYITLCDENSKTPSYTSNIFFDDIVKSKVSSYMHGICSDGENIYCSTNNTSKEMWIVKFDAKTGAYLGKSASFTKTGNAWANDDYLMYKDGYVYIFNTTCNYIKRVKGEDISSTTLPELETVSSLNLKNSDGSDYSATIRAGSYDKVTNKVVLTTSGGSMLIVNGSTMQIEKTISSVSASSATGIYCDTSYIYVFYEQNDSGVTAKFDIYNWSGTKAKSAVKITNLNPSTTKGNNIQGMCVVNNKIYFAAALWGDNMAKIIETTFDASVVSL